jgi:CelD/BcsL family acetyltransferase involved in cellulose biosynthesis
MSDTKPAALIGGVTSIVVALIGRQPLQGETSGIVGSSQSAENVGHTGRKLEPKRSTHELPNLPRIARGTSNRDRTASAANRED